ncbi:MULTISPECIES: hypothetical protein [Fusobacterium]|uniref:hypothetical protein n=1 Tax=Fusobacterium TaxID=848 RepID=UPI0003B82FC4|nr:hypothetical protein [Fusobacterium nucleatum]ERT42657.1 hypothetical protein HMPREF1538_00215 [Fusobacterium nucleatum CTI-1]
MENKILELVVNLILIMTIIINTIIFIKVLQKYIFLEKFTKDFEKEMQDLTKAIDRNEEKVLKIKRILEIRENL